MSLIDNETDRTPSTTVSSDHSVTNPSLPNGLRRLMRMGQVLASSRQCHEHPSLRVVVTVPTDRLAGIAVLLGASAAEPHCDSSCVHTQLDETKRLAACYWDRHLQDRIAYADGAGVHVATSIFPKSTGSVHRLPDGFPADRSRVPRNSNSQSGEEIEDLANAFGEDRYFAGLRRSRMSAHPVLYIGDMAKVREDLDLAGTIPKLAALHPLGRLAPGEHYESWFRHPTLVVKQPPLTSQRVWLTDVRPRLIVRVGQAAVLTPLQGLWPEVPHVILLSRRLPSSVDAIEAIRAMGWKPIHSELDDLRATLRPGDGLEISCLIEPGASAPVSADDFEEDEW